MNKKHVLVAATGSPSWGRHCASNYTSPMDDWMCSKCDASASTLPSHRLLAARSTQKDVGRKDDTVPYTPTKNKFEPLTPPELSGAIVCPKCACKFNGRLLAYSRHDTTDRPSDRPRVRPSVRPTVRPSVCHEQK